MYLYGASGHAKVIIEMLELLNIPVDGLFDDNPDIHALWKYPVSLFNEEYALNSTSFIVSIGDNKLRKKIAGSLETPFGIAIHPKAIISSRALIAEGTVVMAGVTINADAKVGRHCIVNTNASVDHDCTLEDFVHVSPNVALCGGVNVGEGSHIGAGVVVIPGINIGRWCVLGAGAVIIKDVPDYATVVGNPGSIIK